MKNTVRTLMTLPFLLLLTYSLHGQEAVSFRKDVAPLLMDNCLACHGPKKAEGDYRIDSFERFVKAGDSETPGVVPADPEGSEALRRIASDDEGERMPLEADALPADQVALIRRWIEEGAKFDGDDPAAPLASIVPPPVHPAPPEAYRHTLPITALAFSRDGNQLLVSGYHEVTVWDTASGQLLRRITNVGQRTYAIALSDDGNRMAVACGTPGRLGETRIFDTASGELISVLGTAADVCLDAAFNPQGDRLATASADGVIRVFELATGKQQLNITSHSDWVTAICWSRDGALLGSASRDKTSKIFNSTTGELQTTYAGHGQPVQGVAFHPEGKELYSSGGDKKIHRWKIADAKKSAEMSFGGEVFKLHEAGDALFATSADKTARQFDAKSHKQLRVYSGHKDWTLAATHHPDSKRLATGSFDGQVQIWNTETGDSLLTFTASPKQSE